MKSPTTGASKVSKPRLVSVGRRVCEVMCSYASVALHLVLRLPEFITLHSICNLVTEVGGS